MILYEDTMTNLLESATRLESAAVAVLQGKLVVYPTETVYGLGCLPTCDDALRRIFLLKKRALAKALPLIAADEAAVNSIVDEWPDIARRLARAFWPGALSLVLPAKTELPSILHAGTGKVAIRVSSHPIARKLAMLVGGVIVATSANLSGHLPCRDPAGLSRRLLDGVDVVIDWGKTPGQQPSTLLAFSGESMSQIEFLRVGAIPKEHILRVLS